MDNNKNFETWLNAILEKNPMPINTMAVNFNLYESDSTFDVQIIGSSMYDEEDSDWACEETYTSGENCFYLDKSKEIYDKDVALVTIEEMVAEYIDHAKFGYKLKQYIAVCAGFVDGDIEIIWSSDDEEIDE